MKLHKAIEIFIIANCSYVDNNIFLIEKDAVKIKLRSVSRSALFNYSITITGKLYLKFLDEYQKTSDVFSFCIHGYTEREFLFLYDRLMKYKESQTIDETP